MGRIIPMPITSTRMVIKIKSKAVFFAFMQVQKSDKNISLGKKYPSATINFSILSSKEDTHCHIMKKLHLSSLYVLLVLVVLSCKDKVTVATETKKSVKPNILFIMSDDHAYQAISAYSSKLIETPNIDMIAKEGIIFTNASVTNSICAPSRATILTGKHTHINGKTDNARPFDDSQITFPQLFQKAGYETAMFGKLHFGNSPKGVGEFMILPGQGNYINPDFITKKGDTVTITGYVTDIITDLTLDWLDKKRNVEKPFMLMYLHKAPHRPWWA